MAALLLAVALLTAARAQEPRLANLSTRAQAGAGVNVLTAGFVIGPGADKKILVRAIGPTLGAAPFNLPGVLADPQLTLVNGAGVTVATNDDWLAADAATMSSVGAFPLPANSKDAAIVTTLAPGSYTAQVNGAANSTGLALVEIYEVGATNSRLVNLSTRAFVGTGASVMIPGIVVSPGTGTRRLLVRAAGPALGAFGLLGTLADPTITLTNAATGTTVATNDDWGVPSSSGAANETTLTAAFTRAGAFNFPRGGKDSALLVDLAPGNYGIQVSGVATTAGTSTTGLALVEVYDVTPPLAIFSVTPSEGPIAGGTTVTLSGRGFAGATVLLDEQAVTPLAQSDSEIRLRMPAHDNGYVVVTVRSGTNTAATEFLYVPPKLEDLPAGYITTIAGIGNYVRFGQLATLSMIDAGGLAQTPNGDLYFTQAGRGAIWRIRADGILERFAGRLGPVDNDFIGDGGPALDARIGFVRDCAVDAAGNVYAVDQRRRIRKIDAATGRIATVAGTGVHGFSGDGGPATQAQIGEPGHITCRPDGTFYFLEENTRVRKVTPNGIITTVAGTGVTGENGDGGLAINAQINAGNDNEDWGDLTVDPDGNLFILEFDGSRVRRVDAKTGIITTFTTGGHLGPYDHPNSITADASGNVYVAANGGIDKFDSTGKLVTSWGRFGTFSEDGTPAQQVMIGSAMGLTIAPNGDLIYCDSMATRVRRINLATGRVETIAGMAPNVIGVPGPALRARLQSPAGDLLVLPSGDLLYSDNSAHWMYRINLKTGALSIFAGTGSFAGAGDGAPALQTSISPLGMDIDARGVIYGVEKGPVRAIGTDGIVRRFAGRAEPLYTFAGDGGPALDAVLCQPNDVVVDRIGNLLIADTNNNRIRRVDAITGIITTIAGSGPPNGFEGYSRGASSGDGGPALSARFNTLIALAVRDDGTIYASDFYGTGLRKITPNGIISTIPNVPGPFKMVVGPGQSIFAHAGSAIYRLDNDQRRNVVGGPDSGFAGDGGPATLAKCASGEAEYGQGIAIDAEGNLFFQDGGNRRIRAVRFGAVLAPTGATIELRANGSTLRAFVRDAEGRPAPGVRVDFFVPASGPSCVLSRAVAITEANGIAAVVCRSNGIDGTYVVSARPLTAAATATVAFTNLGDRLFVATEAVAQHRSR